MRKAFLLILCLTVLSCKSDKIDSKTESKNRIGIKKFEIANGKIKDSIVEYLEINGKEYANQIWLTDYNDQYIGGNYFEAFIKDTTKLGEVTRLRFWLEPTISYESEMYVLLPIDDDKLENDFSNLFELKLDTFPSLKNDGIPHPELTDLNLHLNYITEFGLEYEESGKKRVRGVIIERGKLNEKGYERRLFFDKTFYIVE
tara:strand:+ start:68 stop:670 length:603 start_codon:yes stop_codon:yes gene_type:complete